jgi:hypothetical protein
VRSKLSYDEAANPLLALGRRSLTTQAMIDKIRDARNMSKRRLTEEELAERPWKRMWSAEWRDYMLYQYYVFRRVRPCSLKLKSLQFVWWSRSYSSDERGTHK